MVRVNIKDQFRLVLFKLKIMKEHHEFKVDEEYEYQGIKHESMIQETFKVSKIAGDRTLYEVLAALMEEVGELSTEVAVNQGYSRKGVGDDGIIGEAVDVIVCALDIIYVDWKNADPVTLEALVMKILKTKLEKWKEKTKQQ